VAAVTTYEYVAYLTKISSEIELPQLPLYETFEPKKRVQGNITIRYAVGDECRFDDVPQGISVTLIEHKDRDFVTRDVTIHLYWRGIGRFDVTKSEIICRTIPNMETAILSNFLVTTALNMKLYLEALFGNAWVLHASAVNIGGMGFVFAGKSGSGKSTLAAALCQRGHAILADDTTFILRYCGWKDAIHPAFPQVKLWSDSLTALGKSPETLPLVHSIEDKRALRVEDCFSPELTEFSALYVLEDLNAAASEHTAYIEPFGVQDAFRAVMAYSYSGHIMTVMGFDLAKATKLRMLPFENLIKFHAVRRLIRPRDLSRLPDVLDLIEQDIASLPE
jgi:hypothetical protein